MPSLSMRRGGPEPPNARSKVSWGLGDLSLGFRRQNVANFPSTNYCKFFFDKFLRYFLQILIWLNRKNLCFVKENYKFVI